MTSGNIRRLAADSNVLLSAVIGKAALRIFTFPGIEVFTTDFNIQEVKEYVPRMAAKYGLEESKLLLQLNLLPLIRKDEPFYKSALAEARKYLYERDPDDMHLGALALKEKIPIWSNDNDLTVLPLSVYSTAQLLKLLELY